MPRPRIRSRRRLARLAAALCLAAVALAAGKSAAGDAGSGAGSAGCTPLFEQAMVTEVYVGLSGPGGRAIPRKDWQDFVATVVVAAFPDGFTVIPARGYWRGEGMTKTAQEESLIFKVIHPAGPEARARLRDIARRYARRFEQGAVLLSTTPTDATLCH